MSSSAARPLQQHRNILERELTIVGAAQAFVAPVPHEEGPVICGWAGRDLHHKNTTRRQLRLEAVLSVEIRWRDYDCLVAVDLPSSRGLVGRRIDSFL